MARDNFRIEGMKELQAKIKKLEKLPAKVVGKAARKGAKIAHVDAKKNAPVDSGDLKKHLVMRIEKGRKPTKKVYKVMPDPKKNPLFERPTKDGSKVYFYPASVEHGFFARDGSFIPGYHFMEEALTKNESKIETTIIKEMIAEIDKIN